MSQGETPPGRVQNLSAAFDQLPYWERDLILGRVRKSYIYARSAAQRALARATQDSEFDALIETIWWIGVCDSYLWTIFRKKWTRYKHDRSWSDLISGISWARNQTLHDPLAIAAVVERWEIVDGVYKRLEQVRWAEYVDIPIASPELENQRFAESYRTAVEGRIIIDTLTEAVEVMRSISIDELAMLRA